MSTYYNVFSCNWMCLLHLCWAGTGRIDVLCRGPHRASTRERGHSPVGHHCDSVRGWKQGVN